MSHKTTRETAVQARVNDGSHIIRSLQYSLQYGTDTNHVYIEPKPHDCDFDKAPRGIGKRLRKCKPHELAECTTSKLEITMADIKIGDTVEPKAGGPMMTVEKLEEVYGVMTVWCQWFEEAKGPKKSTTSAFPLSALKRIRTTSKA